LSHFFTYKKTKGFIIMLSWYFLDAASACGMTATERLDCG